MSVLMGDEGRIGLLQASEHVRTAISILDKLGAPADIAAHLDLAAERILDLTGERSQRVDGANDDLDPPMASSS